MITTGSTAGALASEDAEAPPAGAALSELVVEGVDVALSELVLEGVDVPESALEDSLDPQAVTEKSVITAVAAAAPIQVMDFMTDLS